ncbi:NAD-dependent epimerase/dehydratase family protein [Arthrobacter sp. 2MCAF15]|uniref:NAD-dependent epimerase/dehydratase family protein n=1 Tax=Arthrobacter sp. 2MCAF15 TaxID=3232984 RepID=UPI003F8FB21A
MKRAVILGGTGVLGRAIAWRLIRAGWAVEITGRDRRKMPVELTEAGARFIVAERRDDEALARVVGGGADLLVDAVCYTEADARQLLPHLPAVTSAAMLSSKAVYVDAAGNHVNSDAPPRFDAPILESNPTMVPGAGKYDSREGYGANKVAAEHALLDSGHPVTVIRASKVHGEGAAMPREWMFVKRVLDRRPAVFLAHAGLGGDHTTAAVNTAALVERVAAEPGPRVLNSADPDAPNARQIAAAIAQHLGHQWEEVLLDATAPAGLGDHPWDFRPPLVLSTKASLDLGYEPVGTYAQTIPLQLDWLVQADAAGAVPGTDDPFFEHYIDYAPEEQFTASRPGRTR